MNDPFEPQGPGETPEQRRKRLQTAQRIMPQDATKYANPKLPFRAMPEWGGVPDITKPGQGSTPLIEPRQQPQQQQQKDLLRPPPAQPPGPRAEPVQDPERPQKPRVTKVEQPGIPVLGRLSRGVSRMLLGDPEKQAQEQERKERQRLSDVQDIERGDRPGPQWWKNLERRLSRGQRGRQQRARERTERVPKPIREAMDFRGPVFEQAAAADPKVRLGLGVARALGMTPRAVAEDPLGALGPEIAGAAAGLPLVGRAAREATGEAPMFFSRLEAHLEGLPMKKGTGAQWLAELQPQKVPGGKLLELEESPLRNYLEENKGTVLTKEQVLGARMHPSPEAPPATGPRTSMTDEEYVDLMDRRNEIEANLKDLQENLDKYNSYEPEWEMIKAELDQQRIRRKEIDDKLSAAAGFPRVEGGQPGEAWRGRMGDPRYAPATLEQRIKEAENELEWARDHDQISVPGRERELADLRAQKAPAGQPQPGIEPLQLTETRYGALTGPQARVAVEELERLGRIHEELLEERADQLDDLMATARRVGNTVEVNRARMSGSNFDPAEFDLTDEQIDLLNEFFEMDEELTRLKRTTTEWQEKARSQPTRHHDPSLIAGEETGRYRELLLQRQRPPEPTGVDLEREWRAKQRRTAVAEDALQVEMRRAYERGERINGDNAQDWLNELQSAAEEGAHEVEEQYRSMVNTQSWQELPTALKARLSNFYENLIEEVAIEARWQRSGAKGFKSGHWDPKDIVVHVRAGERRLPPPRQQLNDQQWWLNERFPNAAGKRHRQAFLAWREGEWTLEEAVNFLEASSPPGSNAMMELDRQVRDHLVEKVVGPLTVAADNDPAVFALQELLSGDHPSIDLDDPLRKSLRLLPDVTRKRLIEHALEVNGELLSPAERRVLENVGSGPGSNLLAITGGSEGTRPTVMHAEEFQSDWAASIRDLERLKKVQPKQITEGGFAGDWELDHPYFRGSRYPSESSARAALTKRIGWVASGTPSMPFTRPQDWGKLAIQRLIHEAVKEGHGYIGWTSGMTQLRRYNLAEVVDSLRWDPKSDLLIGLKNGRRVFSREVPPGELSDYLGENIASQLWKSKNEKGFHELNVGDLPDETMVGDTGLHRLYEEVHLKTLKDYWKQLGLGEPEITRADLAHGPRKEGDDVGSNDLVIKLPQKLIDMVQEKGQPLGIVAPELLAPLAGAGAGAATGATQGETPEDRVRNALLGAVGGAAATIAGTAAVRAAGRRSMVKPPPGPKKPPVYPETASTMALVRENAEADRAATRALQENLKAVGSEVPRARPRDPAGREIPESPGRTMETPEGDVFRVPKERLQGPQPEPFDIQRALRENPLPEDPRIAASRAAAEPAERNLAAARKLADEATTKANTAWRSVGKLIDALLPDTKPSRFFEAELKSRSLDEITSDQRFWGQLATPEIKQAIRDAKAADAELAQIQEGASEVRKRENVRKDAERAEQVAKARAFREQKEAERRARQRVFDAEQAAKKKIPTEAPEHLKGLQEFLLRLDKQPLSREHHTFLRIAEQKIRKGEYSPDEVRELLDKIAKAPLEVEFKTLIRQQLRDLPSVE